jgi:hypothetical protein
MIQSRNLGQPSGWLWIVNWLIVIGQPSRNGIRVSLSKKKEEKEKALG